jgi:hypothetical protein
MLRRPVGLTADGLAHLHMKHAGMDIRTRTAYLFVHVASYNGPQGIRWSVAGRVR